MHIFINVNGCAATNALVCIKNPTLHNIYIIPDLIFYISEIY